MTARLLIGDVFDRLATLETGSVDLILTSPPFLALRSYLPADHPDKAKEIGSEPTPGAYIDTLCALTEEWARVLAPHGSICVELGDTYSGSGGRGLDTPDTEYQTRLRGQHDRPDGEKYGGSRLQDRRKTATNGNRNRDKAPGWPLDKSLCLIPELYRIALVYGFNPLTGRPTPRWRARNVVRWCRPNPPVGALGDKFRPGTSDMVVACKSARRYFDLDAVRTEYGPTMTFMLKGKPKERRSGTDQTAGVQSDWTNREGFVAADRGGAPPLDWWNIPTEPYKGAHYATFPEALVERPIEAMCPRRVCRTCGKPSERIVSTDASTRLANRERTGFAARDGRETNGGPPTSFLSPANITLGWSDCGHDNWRPGIVLDPFAGSGTTLAVAVGHGRSAIGIDLDGRNADLARQRCGMFLTVDETTPNPQVTA